MSQVPPVVVASAASISGASASTSASPSEKDARFVRTSSLSAAAAPKLRSCVTCRTRKVRCDKASPCSNCRRAGIDCVFPGPDNRPPRWARRLERVANSARAAAAAAATEAAGETTHQTAGARPAAVAVDPGVSQVMERLRGLEDLVRDLSSQLERARTTAAATASTSGGAGSPPSVNSAGSANRAASDDGSPRGAEASPAANARREFGRLVLGDSNRSCYVSSGFWSRVSDELEGLKIDAEELAGGEYDSSGDEDPPGKTPSTQELDRTPSERHAFLFRHNLSGPAPDLREFHPLPSQVPFLLDVFSENVNLMCQIVHMPTIRKMMRDLRDNGQSALTPANEALMFAMYYAAVTSMEEDDIMTNFGSSKSVLNLKYRLGLEHALAKADFLSVPDIVLVQALVIFVALVRRHDSPRYVWMMTGLVIRMAQGLGLHRDGSHFPHLTPFEVETRRRVWWAVCLLDVRASEDQGTEFSIAYGSFDTRLPLNINDADIGPETKEMPEEREGLTDATIALVSSGGMCDVTRQLMAVSTRDGSPESLAAQSRLLDEVYARVERRYLRYASDNNIAYWVNVTVARLVAAKLTLITHLPILFSSTPSSSPSPPPSEQQQPQQQQQQQHISPSEMRAKLFNAAVEIAEYNHALNAERACRHWRWVFQTYTHWYAIVYLLLATARRPWSPSVERAWVALHSVWLMPPHSLSNSSGGGGGDRIWVPLRKLMAKARRHRDAEIRRLRGDPRAASRLEEEDRRAPPPASPAPFPGVRDSAEFFRERWRRLVAPPSSSSAAAAAGGGGGGGGGGYEPVYPQPGLSHASNIPEADPGRASSNPHSLAPPPLPPPPPGQQQQPQQQQQQQQTGSSFPADWPPPPPSSSSDPRSLSANSGFGTWLWADPSDPSVDVFANLNMNVGDTTAAAADFNMDIDGGSEEVDWNNWVESAKGMEWSIGEPPPPPPPPRPRGGGWA